MKRRVFVAALAVMAPSAILAHAQTTPPTRTPRTVIRPKPTETPEPIVIDSLSETDYRVRLAEVLPVVIDAFAKVQSGAYEGVKYPARARQKKWVDDYVAQAVTATNGATEIYTIDPPELLALAHVYLLRYCRSLADAVDAFAVAVDAQNIDGVTKAFGTCSFAQKELNKALYLLRGQ